jgi:hypothetical protein
MLSGFLGRNKLHQINFPGLPQLHAWGLNAVKSAGAKWTAGLQLSTSASLSISAPSMIHMEQGNIPGSALSLMQSRLLPTLEHVQQRRRQQNAPPASLPMRLASPSSAPYTQMYPMHAPAMYSPAHFPVAPVPYSQPTYFQYPGSQPAHPFTPMFSPYTFHPPA